MNLLKGASLLALAKSIYYVGNYGSTISWCLFAYTLNFHCIHVKMRSDTQQEIEEDLANQVVDMLQILFSFVLGYGIVWK